MWKCFCSACGSITNVDAYALRSGNTKSCHFCKQTNRDNTIKDISGTKYGLLTVQSLNKRENKITFWNCICDCGNKIIASKSNLINGNTKSCGCLRSYHQSLISKHFSDLDIDFQRQYQFSDLIGINGGNLRFDFAVFKNNSLCFLLQYNGQQHYKDSGWFGRYQRQYSDKAKIQYCLANNIPLYCVSYKQNYIQSINNILQKYMLIPCQAN